MNIVEQLVTGGMCSVPNWDRCCIAGGAIRDSLYGKPIKDVDLFIGVSEGLYEVLKDCEYAQLAIDNHRDILMGIMTRTSKHGTMVLKKNTKSYYGKRPDFISYQSIDNPELNVIVVEHKDVKTNKEWIGKLLQTFPASISKVALDLEDGEMIMTEDFIETLLNKKILYTQWCPSEYRSRLMEKYHNIDGWVHEILVTTHSVMAGFIPFLRPTAFSRIFKT